MSGHLNDDSTSLSGALSAHSSFCEFLLSFLIGYGGKYSLKKALQPFVEGP